MTINYDSNIKTQTHKISSYKHMDIQNESKGSCMKHTQVNRVAQNVKNATQV